MWPILGVLGPAIGLLSFFAVYDPHEFGGLFLLIGAFAVLTAGAVLRERGLILTGGCG